MHIYIDPEFGRSHPLWSEGDNGDNINKYSFSPNLIDRILKWDHYWHEHYTPTAKPDLPWNYGWIEGSDIHAWIEEGIAISKEMKKENKNLIIENKFMTYGEQQ